MIAQAGLVSRQGSYARGGGSLKAQSGQRHWRLRLGCRQGSRGSAIALTETGGTLVTVATEARKLREAVAAVIGTESWCAQLRKRQ